MDEATKIRYEAGQIARRAILEGAKLIKPGNKLVDVVDKVEQLILSSKEFQGFKPGLAFPAQINKNHIAAHFCPTLEDDKEFEEGDIVKLDCGAHYNGYVSDNAVTVDLGSNTELKKASEECLKAAIKLCEPGNYTNQIGRAINETANAYGYAPIKNLSGHGIGQWSVHKEPGVPNFDPGNGTKLKAGMSIAIEPFVTTGQGWVQEVEPSGVFMLTKKRPVRSQMARDALKIIDSYNGLPFALRWIEKEMGSAKANFGIKELLRTGVLRSYGPLVEKTSGLVAQTEHSVIIQEGKPLVITKLDDE